MFLLNPLSVSIIFGLYFQVAITAVSQLQQQLQQLPSFTITMPPIPIPSQNWGSWSSWTRERVHPLTGHSETETSATCADPSSTSPSPSPSNPPQTCQSWSEWVWTAPTNSTGTSSCALHGTRTCQECAIENDCCTLRKLMETISVFTIIVFQLNGNSGHRGVPVGPVEEKGQDPGPATLVTAPPLLAPLSAASASTQLLVSGRMKNLNLAMRLTKVKHYKPTTD